MGRQLFQPAGDEAARAAGEIYHSGVFDTQEYGCEYGKSTKNKDFRGVSHYRKSLNMVSIMKLLVRTLRAIDNVTRLPGVS